MRNPPFKSVRKEKKFSTSQQHSTGIAVGDPFKLIQNGTTRKKLCERTQQGNKSTPGDWKQFRVTRPPSVGAAEEPHPRGRSRGALVPLCKRAQDSSRETFPPQSQHGGNRTNFLESTTTARYRPEKTRDSSEESCITQEKNQQKKLCARLTPRTGSLGRKRIRHRRTMRHPTDQQKR